MIDFELLSPRWLGLGLLAPYFVWFAVRSLADLPLAQRVLSAALRLTFVELLALALARPVTTTTTQKIALVVLVDVSDSVPDAALDDARNEIQRTLDAKPADADVRIVTFARRPRLVPLLDGDTRAPPIARHDPPDGRSGTGSGAGAATDLASALQLAYGLYPAGALRRALILSDGVETEGDALAETQHARSFGVKIFASPYRRPVPGEVAIRDLHAPDHVQVGEPFALRAHIFTTQAQTVKATLKQGEAINGLDGIRSIPLVVGDNEVLFKSVVRVAGEVTYRLDLSEITADHFAENNHYTVSVAVPGRPTVLYVEGNPSRATYLASALGAQDFEVDVRAARELPSTPHELDRYDFVILSDAPADGISLTQQEALERYVRDVGGGLLFAGGENSYGLGGWDRAPLASILPVRMDSEKKRDDPGVAMVLVIDRSGSMSGLPLEMAKVAAKATAGTLAPDDLLEVIAFDSQPTRVVRMTPAKYRARIEGDISRIQPGGGTEVFSALDTAYQALSVTRARKKHVLLLTDGQAPQNGIRDLIQAMVAEGMTVTTVGLGGGIDESLLRMIADVGGGRFYKVSDPQALPRVFTRETEMVSRPGAVEEYFQPKLVNNADFLRGIDIMAAPFLHGYIATQMKPPPAQEILESEIGEPILARWHVGLGWVVSWTSDLKNLWAVEWLRWPNYGQFWGQLVREHMRQRRRHQLDLKAELDPATGHVKASIDAIGSDDAFQNGLEARFEVEGPLPSSEKKACPMPQTAPGRYEADFPLERLGSFLLHASLHKQTDDGKGEVRALEVAEAFGHVTNPYPREYLALAPDRAMLARMAAATSGVLDPEPTTIFNPAGDVLTFHQDRWGRAILAAIAVFLLDLWLRRVRLFDRKKAVQPRATT